MIVAARGGGGGGGGGCVRCAYRAQLRRLQQQRRCASSSVADEWRPSPEKQNLFRKTGGPRADEEPRGPRISYHARLGSEEGARSTRKGTARKWPQIQDLSQWGIGQEGQRLRLNGRDQNFRIVLQDTLAKVKADVEEAPVLDQMAKDQQEWDGKSGREFGFEKTWKSFTAKVMSGSSGNAFRVDDERSLFDDLARAYQLKGKSGLEDRVKYSFYGHVTGSRFTASDIRNQKTMADLRYPTEWYPGTRQLQRTIHLHVGPTNSGKTYHALQRLEQAETGTYAGPLRLLAHEVFTRLNAKGKPCALVTGEERRLPLGYRVGEELEGAYRMTACTVEMMPLNKPMDVAVIDEIQMIGNEDRGWAWTQALLGVMAKEVHLCGEERTVPIIKEICASVGEKLVVHHYKRLSPLAVQESSLDGDLNRLRKGDCVVSFSVMGIHALRKQIEKSTGKKVATVYGSLPPETRAQQARLFNDPNNDYDYLVASDAVGMGLNLAIKRIVFESSSKFNGSKRQTLNIADIKQIGGRAGRFRIAEQGKEGAASAEELAAAKGDADPDAAPKVNDTPENLGLVTTLEKFDFPIVRTAMAAEPEPIQSAGIFPPASILERFATYFPPGTPFSYMLTRLHELSQMHSRYHLCGLKDMVWIADLIEGVEGLSVADRNMLCSCPASKSDTDMWKTLLPAYARCVATQSVGNIAEIEELPLEILESEVQGTREYLRELERLHKGIVTYLWLSYRFAGIFSTRNLAFHVKGLVEDKIEKTLSQFSFSETQRRKLAAKREQELLKNLARESADVDEQQADQVQQSGAEGGVEGGAVEEVIEDKREALPTQSAEHIDDSSFDLGAQLDGLGQQSPTLDRRYLEAQTSQLAGGDHFGGAIEDVVLEEPGLEPDSVEEAAATPAEEAADAQSTSEKEKKSQASD